jgi:hypothetical protein
VADEIVEADARQLLRGAAVARKQRTESGVSSTREELRELVKVGGTTAEAVHEQHRPVFDSTLGHERTMFLGDTVSEFLLLPSP